MKKVIYIAFLLNSFNLFSQNLFPNGSFEKTNGCQVSFHHFPVRNWFSPSAGTPDVYAPCSNIKFGIPKNWAGRQYAFHGKKYIGLFLNSYRGEGYSYGEFLGVELKDTLVKDSSYILKFYAYPSTDSKYEVKKINVGFSKEINILKSSDNYIIPNPIEIDVNRQKFKKSWYEIEFVYKAKGGEQYFYLGSNIKSLDNRIENKYLQENSNWMLKFAAYYYFDAFILKLKNPLIKTPKFQTDTLFTVSNIYFEFNKTNLIIEDSTGIKQLISFLVKNPLITLQIVGHTDSKGSEKYNVILSEKRANSVKEFLVNNGLEKAKIEILARGKSNQISNKDQGNRRVEFKLKNP